MVSLISGTKKKKEIKKRINQTKLKPTDTENKLTFARVDGWGKKKKRTGG